MAKKKDYVVYCHFKEDGNTLQEVIEKYFMIYFKEELVHLETFHES